MFATEAVVGVLNLLWTGTLARRTLASVERDATEEAAPAALRDLRRRVGRYALLSSVGLFLELIVGTRSEFFFLNALLGGTTQIAFYSIAFSAVAGLRLIPQALGSSTAPAFATLFGAQDLRSGSAPGYSRSLRLLLLLTLPLTAAGLALGPELIEEVYGRNYAGAGTPVRILLLAFPVVALSSLANVAARRLRPDQAAAGRERGRGAVDVGARRGAHPVTRRERRGVANAAGAGDVYALHRASSRPPARRRRRLAAPCRCDRPRPRWRRPGRLRAGSCWWSRRLLGRRARRGAAVASRLRRAGPPAQDRLGRRRQLDRASRSAAGSARSSGLCARRASRLHADGRRAATARPRRPRATRLSRAPGHRWRSRACRPARPGRA